MKDDRFRTAAWHTWSLWSNSTRKGRIAGLENKTLHELTTQAAVRMMSSDQLKAFDVSLAPQSLLAAYGDTEFGRSCLAAARLVEVRRALRGSDAQRLR